MARRADTLSISEARRLACAAQGFGESLGSTDRDVAALFGRLGAVQIDSVNVLVRSQELPLFSRLGPHDRGAIPRATSQRMQVDVQVSRCVSPVLEDPPS